MEERRWTQMPVVTTLGDTDHGRKKQRRRRVISPRLGRSERASRGAKSQGRPGG